MREAQLERARSSGDLGQFDVWMHTAYPDYRMRQRSSRLRRTLAHLRDLGRDHEERIEGVRRLRVLDAVAPAARDGDVLPLLRVPLLIEDRDAVALELRRRGINVFFVYAPPLDEYAGSEFCELLRCRREPGGGPATSSPSTHTMRSAFRPGREERDPPDPRSLATGYDVTSSR